MLDKLKAYWGKIPNQFKNRYVMVAVFFLIWMTFFDLSRFPLLWEKASERESLLEKKEELEKAIEANYKKLELLEDSTYLDRFAREEYMMKREDEDLFVIIDSLETK